MTARLLEAEQQIRVLAFQDPLTGLQNRRQFARAPIPTQSREESRELEPRRDLPTRRQDAIAKWHASTQYIPPDSLGTVIATKPKGTLLTALMDTAKDEITYSLSEDPALAFA